MEVDTYDSKTIEAILHHLKQQDEVIARQQDKLDRQEEIIDRLDVELQGLRNTKRTLKLYYIRLLSLLQNYIR